MKKNSYLVFIIIAFAFVAWMSIKMPIPALPLLAKIFGTSNQALKLSVSLNLIGFSISQLVWGPLSDKYGRRPVALIAIVMAIFGASISMLASSITPYITGRFLEGLAVGFAAPIGRSLMADTMDKATMTKVYSWFAIAAILPPALGPIIGGYILYLSNWHYIFACFIVLALALLVISYKKLPETKQQLEESIHISKIARTVKSILSSRKFWQYGLVYAAINGFMIAYYAAMPYWYVVQLHASSYSYAWLAFLPIASYIIASRLTSRNVLQKNMNKLLVIGIAIALASVVHLLIAGLFIKTEVVSLIIFIILFSASSGIITPIANANLMAQFRREVSILSALISGFRVSVAAALVLISTNIKLATYYPLALYGLCLVAGVSLFYLMIKLTNYNTVRNAYSVGRLS